MANVTAAELLCLAPQPLLRLFGGLSIPTPALGSPGCWCQGQQGIVSSLGPSLRAWRNPGRLDRHPEGAGKVGHALPTGLLGPRGRGKRVLPGLSPEPCCVRNEASFVHSLDPGHRETQR